MISVEDAREWEPCGRAVVSRHPGQPGEEVRPGAGVVEDEGGGAEQWQLEGEEELYSSGRTVVWSKLGRPHRCYTLPRPVLQTLRCTFPGGGAAGLGPDRPAPLRALLARDRASLRVFAESGQDYRVALQFPVLQCWTTGLGLLLERRPEPGEQPELRPLLFCLPHPLDDLTRVIGRVGGRSQDWGGQEGGLVWTCLERSLAVSHSPAGGHAVWRVRRATPAEQETGPGWEAGSGLGVGTPAASGQQSSVLTSNLATPSRTPFHSPGSLSRSTPLFHSRPGSPASLAGLGSLLRAGPGSPTPSPSLARAPLHTSICEEKPLPLEVTVCLEQLWVEPSGSVGPRATKCFLARDLGGTALLCLLCPGPAPALALLKYETVTDCRERLAWGAVRRVPARDAVPLPGLDLVLVLDPTGSLLLYSGAVRVCRVDLPVPRPAPLAQEISALALHSTPATPLTAFSAPDSAPGTPLTHRRSSLLPRPGQQAAPPPPSPAMSPVVAPASPALLGLSDPGPRSCLLRGSSSLVHLTLPSPAGPLVTRALAAVKLLLPRELGVGLQASWLVARHAPGPAPTPGKEWELWCRTLLAQAGYHAQSVDLSSPGTEPGPPGKRVRGGEEGSAGDWQQLLSSAHHREAGEGLSRLLGLDHPLPDPAPTPPLPPATVDPAAPLFPHIPALLWALHLLYEECKLCTAQSVAGLPLLAGLLSRLAADLQLSCYQHHYWLDQPGTALPPGQPGQPPSQLSPALLARLSPAPAMPPRPPCVLSHLTSLACGRPVEPFPVLAGQSCSTQLLATCLGLLGGVSGPVVTYVPLPGRPSPAPTVPPSALRPAQSVALLLATEGWDRVRLATLPAALALPLLAALAQCQAAPPPAWPDSAYRLVDRADLAQPGPPPAPAQTAPPPPGKEGPDGLEGLEQEVGRARWPRDLRLAEARRLLQSARPVTVAVTQRPEVSDHDFMEEQEHCLKKLCERTMALPVGRGVAALRTETALPTETLAIPALCLTGKAPPRGAKVELSHIDVSQNMEHWPAFHNGVAAGLRLAASPQSMEVDSTWICFNKPKTAEGNAQTEHAGFLMALGLNGHLAKLGKLESFDYLMKGSEPISIGLLVGMAASRRGSMDVLVEKKLATQLEALLPPTATELPLSHNTQVAALAGVGLLYSGTGHRRMVEVCLRELGRPPGPELENCADRESYSLTAGLALGMITMGRGEELVAGGLADLALPGLLHNHMVGGPRPPHPRRQPSYQIKEGDMINIDVTSPGATLALGMLYWRSGNESVAAWMAAPETSFLLEFVRPDFLMLRTLARGLILWDDILPSEQWIESQVPAAILPFCLVRPPDRPPPGQENLDYETINQAYCNILAGASFVVGLRFAGTWNAAALSALTSLTARLVAVSKRSLADLTGRAVVEQALCVLVLAQGLVMAGSGDLSVLRTCRMMRARVTTNTAVTYGSHMATHLALGLLFLGGGRLGLSQSPEAVAALLVALYPKFPTHSADNRYHLQALRHLYALAVEPRLVVARCSRTGELVQCRLGLQYQDTPQYRGPTIELAVPALLPALSALSALTLAGPDHWTVSFRQSEDWAGLQTLLTAGGGVAVQRKVGPGLGEGVQWAMGREQLSRLAATPACTTYLARHLTGCPAHWVSTLHCLLAACLAAATPDLIPVLTTLLARPASLESSQAAAQTRAMLQLARHPGHGLPSLLHPELALSLSQRVAAQQDGEPILKSALRRYLVSPSPVVPPPSARTCLAATLSLHSLPPGEQSGAGQRNPLRQAALLRNSLQPATLFRLMQ